MSKSTPHRSLTHLHTHAVSSRKVTSFDRAVFVVSFLYPLSALPQAIEVLSGRAEGVSLLSWVMLMCCSALFLVYGLKHKVPPMIASNALWIVVDGVIVAGIILQNA